MIKEEFTREEDLRIRGLKRAWKYEEKLKEGKDNSLARKCWEEIRERAGREKVLSKWEESRINTLKEKGINTSYDGRQENMKTAWLEIERKEKEICRRERKEEIRKSKYNKWYKEIRTPVLPKYLEKGWKEEKWARIARFRLGNGVKEAKYWKEVEKKKCRKCGWKIEIWEHILEECNEWKEDNRGTQDKILEILGEEGQREDWMEKWEMVGLNKKRKEKKIEKDELASAINRENRIEESFLKKGMLNRFSQILLPLFPRCRLVLFLY